MYVFLLRIFYFFTNLWNRLFHPNPFKVRAMDLDSELGQRVYQALKNVGGIPSEEQEEQK